MTSSCWQDTKVQGRASFMDKWPVTEVLVLTRVPLWGLMFCGCHLRFLNFTTNVYCKWSNGTMASETGSLSSSLSCHPLLDFDLVLGHHSPIWGPIPSSPHIHIPLMPPSMNAAAICHAGAWALRQGRLRSGVHGPLHQATPGRRLENPSHEGKSLTRPRSTYLVLPSCHS